MKYLFLILFSVSFSICAETIPCQKNYSEVLSLSSSKGFRAIYELPENELNCFFSKISNADPEWLQLISIMLTDIDSDANKYKIYDLMGSIGTALEKNPELVFSNIPANLREKVLSRACITSPLDKIQPGENMAKTALRIRKERLLEVKDLNWQKESVFCIKAINDYEIKESMRLGCMG